MILAGDVGGTKTLLALFEPAERRPTPVALHTYLTNEYTSFTEILDTFARNVRHTFSVTAAVVGVAGPVIANRARLTNVAWDVAADEITARFGTGQVALLNDLEALANSVEVLEADEFVSLQDGIARQDGNAVVIAAGTGLGQAYLHRVGRHLRPVASEGGHADFAARTDREIELVRMLREMYGRAEVEHVLSGPGLVNLYRFTHRGGHCSVVEDPSATPAPALISQAAMSGRCQFCAEALRMFVTAYGAETGNLALRGVATAGVFVGGGIGPKILRAIQNDGFMDAFLAKGRMSELLRKMPVKVILTAEAGLIGAAVYANGLLAQ